MVQFKGKKIIPLSKKKLALLLVGSTMFVVIGLSFILTAIIVNNPLIGNKIFLFISGISSFLFSGLCAIYSGIKLKDDKPGIIIDNFGITDNSSGLSVGQILWTDIESISIYQMLLQKFIILKVTNPQEYIDKEENNYKRKMMILNYKMCGSPISIGSNSLEISFNGLLSNITDSFNANRQ